MSSHLPLRKMPMSPLSLDAACSVPFTLGSVCCARPHALVLPRARCRHSPCAACQCTDVRRFVRDGAGAACVPSAMWIFMRQQARDEGLVAKGRGIAVAKGVDVSVLKYVNQTACVSAA